MTQKYRNAVRNFVFGYKGDNVKREICFFLYLDVQLQEAQVPHVSIREYANIFTLCDG